MPYNWDAPFELRDRRNGEWYWVQKGVLASKKINASDKLVYSALAYFANNKSQAAFPSYNRICELINLSKNTVIKAVRNLIKYKFISKKRKEGRVNYYELLKVTSANFAPVQKRTRGGAKENHHPTQKRASNNTYLTRLNNNNGVVKKITSWAYNRAKVNPSCSKGSFQKSIVREIERVGENKVMGVFKWSENAIQFLQDIKSL
ncbi:MAG TPA: helix-turn-helix domain-containing protein [bacterium]|nr:helix-turn-helix domain-containing protein [bacterium]